MKDDESLEGLLETVERLAREIRELKRALSDVRRYLRDEGFGDDSGDGPEDLDDD